jgi:hypothetical protein
MTAFVSDTLSLVKALCKDCVVERCRVLRLKNQLNEDYKAVNNLLKSTMKGYVPALPPSCQAVCRQLLTHSETRAGC